MTKLAIASGFNKCGMLRSNKTLSSSHDFCGVPLVSTCLWLALTLEEDLFWVVSQSTSHSMFPGLRK